MKNWMFILADIGGLIVVVLILKSFFAMFGEKRWSKLWINLLADFIFVGLGTINNVFKFNQIVFAVLLYLLIVAYSFMYVIKPFRRFYSSVLSYVFFIISEMLMGLLLSAITHMTVEQTMSNIICYTLTSILTKLILYAIIKPISSYVVCKSSSMPKLAMVAFIILPITTFLVLYFLSEYVYASNNSTSQVISFVISLMLIISNIVVFFILDYVSKQKDKEKLVETKARQLEYERQYYRDLYEKQTINDRVTHDLKNQFFAFRTILKENPNKAEQKLDEIAQTFNEVSAMKITGNVSIDSLLNYKINKAKENDISVKVVCCIGQIENIDIVDLGVIFGNLIDNSIEACLKIPDKSQRFIDINIKQKIKFLHIIINNSYIKEPVINNTSKEDKVHHGFGIKNVQDLCDKYNGYYMVTEKDNQYSVVVGVEDRND